MYKRQVLGPAVWAHSDKIEISGNQKFELDKLHKQKIYMSDCIFVVNENNYWGDSTKGEIQYATNLNKPVFYCFDFEKKFLCPLKITFLFFFLHRSNLIIINKPSLSF